MPKARLSPLTTKIYIDVTNRDNPGTMAATTAIVTQLKIMFEQSKRNRGFIVVVINLKPDSKLTQ